MLFFVGVGKLLLNFIYQIFLWWEEYKGQVNLYVFEDWCGGVVGYLRRNLYFLLFFYICIIVKKLVVFFKWKNYGFCIFGFIYLVRDGDVQFFVVLDDNLEFWLSLDESFVVVQFVVFVGKIGFEWIVFGEFIKFSFQVFKFRWFMVFWRYYFELLYKQDDCGLDYVEVGW